MVSAGNSAGASCNDRGKPRLTLAASFFVAQVTANRPPASHAPLQISLNRSILAHKFCYRAKYFLGRSDCRCAPSSMNGASLPTVAYKTERELWSWHATFQKEKIRIKTLSDNAMHASCHLFRSSMVRYRVTPAAPPQSLVPNFCPKLLSTRVFDKSSRQEFTGRVHDKSFRQELPTRAYAASGRNSLWSSSSRGTLVAVLE